MLTRGALAGALASVLVMTGCASTQQAVGVSAIAAGVGVGAAGAGITRDTCAGYDLDHKGNPNYCLETRHGHPEIGVPLLIGAGALVVAGIVLVATDAAREKPPMHPPLPPPEVVHSDRSGYDTLK